MRGYPSSSWHPLVCLLSSASSLTTCLTWIFPLMPSFRSSCCKFWEALRGDIILSRKPKVRNKLEGCIYHVPVARDIIYHKYTKIFFKPCCWNKNWKLKSFSHRSQEPLTLQKAAEQSLLFLCQVWIRRFVSFVVNSHR